MRYLIKISYDGANFNGYQKQPGKRTVEDCFEKALYSINNHTKTKIYSSGRTDSGVHALGQMAHFDIDVEITSYKLKCALNSLLPDDIHVVDVKNVDNDFNSRFDVKTKTYEYKINIGEYNPIERKYVYQFNKELNVDKMKNAIKDFEGEHDFKPFVSDEAKKNNYVRKVVSTKINEKNGIITIRFKGNGFMKYQVRNMVGTLIKIGMNKIEVDSVKKILSGDLNKKHVFTAPSEGLYLVEVKY